MNRWITPLIALCVALAFGTPSQAQLDIRVPFVRIQVGNGVRVQAPFVHVYVPPRGQRLPPPVIAPPPVVGAPGPEVPVQPMPPAFEAPAPRPLDPPQGNAATPAPEIVGRNTAPTHQDFAASFKPAPGNYEVEMLHPVTRRPVRVNFTLPAGDPKVTVSRRAIEFDYGREVVEIRFLPGGRVQVERS